MAEEDCYLLPGDFEGDEITAEPVSLSFLGKDPLNNNNNYSSYKKKRSFSPAKEKDDDDEEIQLCSPTKAKDPKKKEESRPPKKQTILKPSKMVKEIRRGSFDGKLVSRGSFDGKLVGSRVLKTLQDEEAKKRYALSDGWEKEICFRMTGAQAGKHDTYLLPPGSKKLRSNVELLKYCLKHKIAADAKTLNFEKSPGPMDEDEMTGGTRRLKDQIEALVESNFQMDEGELSMLKPKKGSKAQEKLKNKHSVVQKKKIMKDKVHDVDVEDLFEDDEIDIVEDKRTSFFGSAKKSPIGITSKGLKLSDIPKKPMTTARKSTGGGKPSSVPTMDLDKNFKEKQLEYLQRQFNKLTAKGRRLSDNQAEYISKQLKVKARMVLDWWSWKEQRMNQL